MVTLRASHTVKPAEPLPEEVMYLSDCDQIKPLTHAPTIYFFTQNTQISLEDVVEIMKDSLSKALVIFYPLAGRLYWTNGGRVELRCNSMGAVMIEAESDRKIDDFGDFLPTPEIRSLIPSVDYNVTPIHEVPLLLVQITKFSCGGFSLGIGVSHIVVDGESALHFVAEWAKIARGEESDDPPFLDRKILQQKGHQLLTQPNLEYSDFIPVPLILGKSDNLEERNKETTAIVLKLSKEQIEAIRDKANLDFLSNEQMLETDIKEKSNKDPNGKEQVEALNGKGCQEIEHTDEGLKNKAKLQHPFSRFEAICAHIWKCLSGARGLKPEQETVLFLSVDFRHRINPPLPKRYFGNAVFHLPVSATVGELLSNPVGYVARKIRAAIENLTDEYVRSYLLCIKNMPNISSKRHFHTVGCSQGTFFGNPNMMVTSWVKLPLYSAKFGWGNEIFMGPGSLGYDGKGFLIPGKSRDGSFLIPFRLQVEHVSAFQKYFYEEIEPVN